MKKVEFNENYTRKEGEFAPETFKRMYPGFTNDKDFLLIEEKLLDKLPEDWMDCVMALIAYNYDKWGSPVLCMDDDESVNFFRFLAMDQIKIFVLSGTNPLRGESIFMVKNKPDSKDPVRIFGGCKYLRNYCDERNIYYRSTWGKTDKNEKILYSVTDLKYEKNPGEDCSIPIDLK